MYTCLWGVDIQGMRNPKEFNDEALLQELMDWTRIYRNEGKLPDEERKYYRSICEEIRKRKLMTLKKSQKEIDVLLEH